jgi:hypothetical protein
VCFEVDHVEDLVNWHSSICWGRYEELNGTDAQHGLQVLREALRERLPRHLEHGQLAAEESTGDAAPVVFRINVREMSGREERLYWDLSPIIASSATGPELTHHAAEADGWLSHPKAQQLADLSHVLQIDDIWDAADRLGEGRPPDEVERSLTYQGTEPDMAHRLVGFMLELRDHQPEQRTTELGE